MREFRIYDNTKKRFVTNELCWVVTPDGKLFELDDSDLIGRPDCIKEDDSGLTDKNGKKIFEGDIVVQTTDYYELEEGIREVDEKGLVVYDKDGYYLKFSKCNCASLQHIMRVPHNRKGLVMRHEVIGNIHANPELLEVEK